MDDREQRIRERAHKLWEDEGRPEGRAEAHWVQAKEILAIEEPPPDAFKPVSDGAEDRPEPIEALANLGEFTTLTDQGEMQIPQRPAPDPSAAAPDDTPDSQASRTSTRETQTPQPKKAVR